MFTREMRNSTLQYYDIIETIEVDATIASMHLQSTMSEVSLTGSYVSEMLLSLGAALYSNEAEIGRFILSARAGESPCNAALLGRESSQDARHRSKTRLTALFKKGPRCCHDVPAGPETITPLLTGATRSVANASCCVAKSRIHAQGRHGTSQQTAGALGWKR